jgi:hypothetical protein
LCINRRRLNDLFLYPRRSAYSTSVNQQQDKFAVHQYSNVRRVTQSVYCLATGWTTERSRFDPRQRRKDSSSILCVQIGSGAHPASCTMGTILSPGVKRGRGVRLTTHTNLVSKSRMSRSYTSSPPKRLRGV